MPFYSKKGKIPKKRHTVFNDSDGGRFYEELMRLKDLGEARENADAYRQGLPRRART